MRGNFYIPWLFFEVEDPLEPGVDLAGPGPLDPGPVSAVFGCYEVGSKKAHSL